MSWCLRADRLLLKDEENLKCFTRTQRDFTCFFETPDNGTYDLFYRVSGYARRGCMEPPDGAPDYWNCAFPPVTSQDQKVPTVCADDRRGNVPPRLLISCRGRSLVRGNAAGGCGAQQQHPPVLTDRLCGRSPWEMFFSDPTRSIYLTHFLWSRCCRSKRWLLFRLVRGRKIDPSVLWVFICPLIHPSEAVSCL